MSRLKRCVLIVGLVLLLPGAAALAQGLGEGWQVHTNVIPVRNLTLEGYNALSKDHTWATTDRDVVYCNAREQGRFATADGLVDDNIQVIVVDGGRRRRFGVHGDRVGVSGDEERLSNVTFISASLPPGGTGNVHYWPIGPLAPAMPGTIVLTIAAPTLELTKRDDPDPVTSGAPLTYTLAYTNTGGATAAGVVITDVLDSHVAYVSASPTPTDWTPPTLSWSIGPLAPSSPGEIVISVTVQGGLTEDTTVTNSARIDSQQSSPLSVIETTSVLSHSAPVSVTLTPASATIAAGQSIPYALVAHDTFGNDWDAAASANYTITPAAGGASVTNVYTAEKDGTWTITTTYLSRIDTATLTVTNVAPTAVISGPTTGAEGELLTFDASLSEDPGDDITSYGWDFDYSGTFVTDTSAISATHVYPDNGAYTLALQVTDDEGASDIATATITIHNVAPSVYAGSNQIVTETESVNLSGVFTDPGSADTHAVRWDFGDGASLTSTLAPTHVYTEPGSLQVTLTITDDDGGVGSDDLTVTVQNLAPTVDAGGPYSGTAGTQMTLIASGSDPGGGPLTYTWDLDDDGDYDDGTGDVVAYTWTAAGTHTVAVRAADSGQATDTDTAQVSIDPAELFSIVLSPPTSTILAGQAQAYTVEAFDVYANSRGMVTTETTFSVVESGDGGTWVGNVYTSANYGDWTVRAVYTGTIVVADTASLRVLAPDLGLAKSADRESVEAGDYLTYTLSYSNAGNQAATGVVITDTLDPNVDYVVGSALRPPTGYANGDPYWSLDSLAPDHSGQITFSVQVHRPLPNHTILTNTAWIDSVETTPLSATQQTTVTSRPVLTITKTGFPDTVEPNGILRYTIVITNSGNENATPVTVTEQYDPYVSFFSSDPPPSDAGSGDRTWVFPSLDVDASRTINIFVQADSIIPMGTILTNQVTLESGQTAPMTATETTSVSSAAEFTFYKYGLSDPVEAGALLDYVIHYYNHGDSPAFNVVVTETYDSRVTFVSAVPAPSKGNNVWDIGTLAVGAFGDIRVTVRVATPLSNGSTLTNRATIKGAGTFAKSYTETTRVSSAPDLTFIVTDTPDPVEAGAPLTYTLRYTNTGNADATGVVITATLDGLISFAGSDPEPEPTSGGSSDQVRSWNVGTIPGEGGYGEIIIQANVPFSLTDGTILTFTAQLKDAEGDFLERTAQTTVHSLPDLFIEKVGQGHEPILFSPGGQMAYILTYGNAGYGDAEDVIITTTLPPGTTYEEVGAGWQPSGDRIYTYAVHSLPARFIGHTITFTVVHIDTPAISAPEFNTPFTIAARGGAGDEVSLDNNTTSVYVGVPDLLINDLSVEPGPASVQANVPITFTFTITLMNQGTGTACNPDGIGSFFVDVFTAPVASYPCQCNSEICEVCDPIEAGLQPPPVVITRVITPSRHSLVFYVKVDNHPLHPYGLVPEFNEMNNVTVWPPRVLLPIVLRNYRTWNTYYEENDHWLDAYGPLASGQIYEAYPDDTNDYYYFELSAPATVSASVEDFAPASSNGDLLLYGPASGDHRGDLKAQFGQSGHPSMSIGPHPLGPGKYYVRVYTVSGHYSTNQLYRLTVTY